MKVLITKSANDSWYYHKVGEIVEVELSDDNFYKYIHDKTWGLFIKVKDCEEIKEKYMNDKEIAEFIEKIATTIKEDIDKNIVNELIDRIFMILKENVK